MTDQRAESEPRARHVGSQRRLDIRELLAQPRHQILDRRHHHARLRQFGDDLLAFGLQRAQAILRAGEMAELDPEIERTPQRLTWLREHRFFE
ncbi:MAG TPA: hypothetical protein VMW19_17720 [Myxococcota bacterium]|nr:hypothetical protein [Myxococcota bacterium]